MPVPGRLLVIREGHGEAGAIENLTVRAIQGLGLDSTFWSIPPSPRFVITSPESAVRAAAIAAESQPAAALLTADLDDGCPKFDAPRFSAAIRAEVFPFPIAVVLFYREFETLAISVADRLGGRELVSTKGQSILTLTAAEVPSDPEAPRDAKGWVSRELMEDVSYKPTVHQLPLTRKLDVDELRAAGLSSYRRLESALQFLAAEVNAGTAGCYPP